MDETIPNEEIKEEVTNKQEESVQEEQTNSETILKSEFDDLNDRYKRMMAEFDNYRKRNEKEKEERYHMILADIMKNILPVIDNLEKAVEAKSADEGYQEGIRLILKQMKDLLEKNGVEEIETVGKTFDPEYHEAVSHIEDEKYGTQEIIQEYRKGYKIGLKVIRHSMVVVAN